MVGRALGMTLRHGPLVGLSCRERQHLQARTQKAVDVSMFQVERQWLRGHCFSLFALAQIDRILRN